MLNNISGILLPALWQPLSTKPMTESKEFRRHKNSINGAAICGEKQMSQTSDKSKGHFLFS